MFVRARDWIKLDLQWNWCRGVVLNPDAFTYTWVRPHVKPTQSLRSFVSYCCLSKLCLCWVLLKSWSSNGNTAPSSCLLHISKTASRPCVSIPMFLKGIWWDLSIQSRLSNFECSKALGTQIKTTFCLSITVRYQSKRFVSPFNSSSLRSEQFLCVFLDWLRFGILLNYFHFCAQHLVCIMICLLIYNIGICTSDVTWCLASFHNMA